MSDKKKATEEKKSYDVKKITGEFLIERVVGEDKKYCFILGSGASRSSGIPTGKELAQKWFDEIKLSKVTIEDRIKYLKNKYPPTDDEGNSDEFLRDYYNHFKRIMAYDNKEKVDGEDYSYIYDLRFVVERNYYKEIQGLMKTASPGLGYYCLAKLMENTRCKLVITTNFDSLIETAIFNYTSEKPMVIQHKAMAEFIEGGDDISTPTVAKVHNGMYFRPLSSPKDLQNLAEEWKKPLESIFNGSYIPIVIGYSGEDNTLMKLLEDAEFDEIYWCHLDEAKYDEAKSDEEKEKYNPPKRVYDLLSEKEDGYIVQIEGFDQFVHDLCCQYSKRFHYYQQQSKISQDQGLIDKAKDYEWADDYISVAPNIFLEKFKKTVKSISDERIKRLVEDFNNFFGNRVYSPELQVSVEESGEKTLDEKRKKVIDDYIKSQNGDKSSLEAFRNAMDSDSNNATLWYALGINFFYELDFVNSIKSFKKATQTGNMQHFMEYHYSLGCAYHKYSRHQDEREEKIDLLNKAIASYDDAIGIDPNDPRPHQNKDIAERELKELNNPQT